MPVVSTKTKIMLCNTNLSAEESSELLPMEMNGKVLEYSEQEKQKMSREQILETIKANRPEDVDLPEILSSELAPVPTYQPIRSASVKN